MSSDRAEALHAELVEQVTALRSSAEWLEAMAVAARFHDYSFGNWLLLWSQAEQRGVTLSRVAGYRAWERLGRHVRRGERGFQILAPVTRKIRNEDDETGTRRVVCGFRVATVFDVAQTDGDPLPEVGPRRLTGDDPTRLAEVAEAMIRAEGFGLELGHLAGPNGVTRLTERTVTVDDRLEPAQRTKTTVHELAHVLLHAGGGPIDCRGRIEVEAESVAYVVCAAVGLDTTGYSIPYVAGWAENTADPAQALIAAAERVVRTARRILERFNDFASSHVIPNQNPSSHYQSMSISDMMATNVAEPVDPVGSGERSL